MPNEITDKDREYHSIVFEIPGETEASTKRYPTYSLFNLVPETRPLVSSPGVKTTFVDIPGANGSLDYTQLLTGTVKYEDRKGSWKFYVENGYQSKYGNGDWQALYSDIMRYIHGKYFEKIILLDEPEYYYSGRVWVNEWASDPQFSKVVIDYQLDPYKTPVESEDVSEWLWNDLFSNVIKYHEFNVDGKKDRTFIVGGDNTVHVFPEGTDVTVKWEGLLNPVLCPADEDTEIQLPDSETRCTFTGVGKVTVTYAAGKRL